MNLLTEVQSKNSGDKTRRFDERSGQIFLSLFLHTPEVN